MIKFLLKFQTVIQTFFLLLLNHDFKIWYLLFKNKKALVSQSPLKYLCAPGLNCYSCPSAVTSCPIGSLQFCLNDIALRFNLKEKINLSVFYVLGFLGITGIIGGRIYCGWVCPFGFIQKIINKITNKNIKIFFHSKLIFLPFIILLIFVIILPLFVLNITEIYPWFCKFICPEGTLKAGAPLLIFDKNLRLTASFITLLKFIILGLVIFFLFFNKRFFCKYICPLGAIWGIFNCISFLKLTVDNKCNDCGKCEKACPMHIEVNKKPNHFSCIRCGDCIKACPTESIRFKFIPFRYKNQIKKNRRFH